MVVRFKLMLSQDEANALMKLARAEERNPESQVRYILRNVLMDKHLLPSELPVVNSREVDNV